MEIVTYHIDKDKDLSGLIAYESDVITDLFWRFGIQSTEDIIFIDRLKLLGTNLFEHTRFVQAYANPDVSAFGIYLDTMTGGVRIGLSGRRCLIIANSCMIADGTTSNEHVISAAETLFEKKNAVYYQALNPEWTLPSEIFKPALDKLNHLSEEEENRMLHDYLENDILATRDLVNALSFTFDQPIFIKVKPVKVIFNNPATIVIWDDGTKTIVKRQKGDRYDKEKGLALCYMKKALGNTSRKLNDALRKGLDE